MAGQRVLISEHLISEIVAFPEVMLSATSSCFLLSLLSFPVLFLVSFHEKESEKGEREDMFPVYVFITRSYKRPSILFSLLPHTQYPTNYQLLVILSHSLCEIHLFFLSPQTPQSLSSSLLINEYRSLSSFLLMNVIAEQNDDTLNIYFHKIKAQNSQLLILRI
jgi:hypothetical protein